MNRTDQSLLGLALLGLMHAREPCSGYDLRKIFTTTPMGTFSDSPGAIYPALARLEKTGLIRGRVQESSSLRRRKLYRLTAAGEAALKQWLKRPVGEGDVVRGMSELSLRFAFLQGVLGKRACMGFLESLAGAIARYLPTLRAHLRQNGASMPLSARLALEGGIMGYEAQLAWARKALHTYENE